MNAHCFGLVEKRDANGQNIEQTVPTVCVANLGTAWHDKYLLFIWFIVDMCLGGLSAPKGFGRQAGFAVKDTAEVAAIAKANGKGNFGYIEAGFF